MCSVESKSNDHKKCATGRSLSFDICDGTKPSSSQACCTVDDQTTKEAYINLIKRHKLYPVLELILKKCELATWHMSKDHFAVNDVCKLIEQLEEDGDRIGGEDKELDSLIIDAIFALRIHLIELSKVFDLCADFKLKYMQSLKKTMNQETMIGMTGDSDEDSGCSSGPIVFSDQHLLSGFNPRNNTLAMLATANGMVTIPLAFFNSPTMHTTPSCSTAIHTAATAESPTLFMPQQPQPINKASELENRLSRSNDNLLASQLQQCSDDDDRNDLKRKLPSKAVELLKAWYYKHSTHPYPSESEKCELCKETGLHITQINNWFINARRRIATKTPTTAADSDEVVDSAAEWSSPPKKQKKEQKSASCSYTIERFFADQKSPKAKE